MFPSRFNTFTTVSLINLFLANLSLFFGTKVVNTELHKALPALATHVDYLCVEALQVSPIYKNTDCRNLTIIYKSNNLFSISTTF